MQTELNGLNRSRNDAYVRGDITPLSTNVAGMVRDIKLADYQAVHRGDLIAELEDTSSTAILFGSGALNGLARMALALTERAPLLTPMLL